MAVRDRIHEGVRIEQALELDYQVELDRILRYNAKRSRHHTKDKQRLVV
jgi:hypothetical protein